MGWYDMQICVTGYDRERREERGDGGGCLGLMRERENSDDFGMNRGSAIAIVS